MNAASRTSIAVLSICVFGFLVAPSLGEISVGVFTKEKAQEKYGITMHARQNGDAGMMVWLEFKQQGWLEKFTYAELRMEDAQGKHLLSARLEPHPVQHGQAKDITSVAFSAEAGRLSQCSFLVVCYGSNEGDVGYYLKVKDFLDLTNPTAERPATRPASTAVGAVAAKPGVTVKPFGKVGGEPVELYTLTNATGLQVSLTNYGGTIVSVLTRDRDGKYDDVVLGYHSVDEYVKGNAYFGALLGRYANRIANGKFSLEGKEYALVQNDHGHHRNGGTRGFDKVIWKAEVPEPSRPMLKLSYVSRDGEEGYPGNLAVTVTYGLMNSGCLGIGYQAKTDKATPVNLTNQTYFNLAGAGSGDVLGHELEIHAERFSPVDKALIPTGELQLVQDTPFDFRTPTAIGQRINQADEQLKHGGGYDHDYVLREATNSPRLAARVYEPKSGRTLRVYTTEAGLRFSSGNFLDGTIVGKGGKVYQHRSGFCLAAQHFPDSPNKPNFPSTILAPGKEYSTTTIYQFSTLSADPAKPAAPIEPAARTVGEALEKTSSAAAGDLPLPQLLDALDGRTRERAVTEIVKQRRARFRSLYVETRGETTSPLTKDELLRLPDGWYAGFLGTKAEFRYAAKGENRFSHCREQLDRGSVRLVTRAYNGTSIWHRTVDLDGQGSGVPFTSVRPTQGSLRFIYPNAWEALNIGEAISGPNLQAQDTRDDLFYFTGPADQPETAERWTLAAEDTTEVVEGTECVLLSGTIEMTFREPTGPRTRVRHVKCWLDRDRGLPIRRWEDTAGPTEVLCRITNSHFEQVEAGLWIPLEITLETFAPAEAPQYPPAYRGKLLLTRRITVTKHVINQVPDDLFDVPLNLGENVDDTRGTVRAKD